MMVVAIATILLFVVIGLAALLMPLVRFLTTGWATKRMDIMGGLNADARLAYFEMFCRTDGNITVDDAMSAFDRLYARGYGRGFFAVPGILLAAVGIVVTTLVTMTCLHRLKYPYLPVNPMFDVPDTAMAAIAGGYLWAVNDLISRARRLDFTSADVQWAAFRLIISIPMGYAFAALASKSVGPFVAFALGAFPLGVLTSMLERLTNKTLRIEPTAAEAHDDIVRLQGINRTIVERLAAEDITTVTQIAYCDPVRLVMRSNLTFNFVTDCMNQALAWMYFDEQITVLRPLGLRGAVEIKCLIDEFDNASPDGGSARQRAAAALPMIAAKLGQDEKALQITFRQIAEDPFTVFLHRVWT
ncbi:hypothetical protein [Ralstonia pseudosolanacearum]|uniref:hypothetical protein n=1 Tax=Ralstonia pseudosolanacearum TaxID=1310165 RepID=UPI001FF9EE90|nr:hypothetical protein [Ralstonia pseudosolanacearum]